MTAFRLLAFAALALTLAACDSGSDSDDATLAGTWDTQSGRTADYITVSQTQSARDPDSPGTGGLAVSGAVSGTLRYFTGLPGQNEQYATDAPLLTDAARLALLLDGADTRLGVVTGGVARFFELVSFSGPVAYTQTDAYVDVTSALFRDPDTNDEATVSGRLTFARIALTANRETLFRESTSDRADASVLQVTFDDGGVYRQLNQDVTTTTGTWVQVGDDEVRVRIGDETTDYAFEIDGTTLTLTSSEDFFDGAGCNAECQQFAAAYFGVIEGTLVNYRSEQTRTFRRGDEDDEDGEDRPAATRPARAHSPFPEAPGWSPFGTR